MSHTKQLGLASKFQLPYMLILTSFTEIFSVFSQFLPLECPLIIVTVNVTSCPASTGDMLVAWNVAQFLVFPVLIDNLPH